MNWRAAAGGNGTGLIGKLAQANIDEVAPLDDELLVIRDPRPVAFSLRERLAETTLLRVRETTRLEDVPALLAGSKARGVVLCLPDLSLAALHSTVAAIRRVAEGITLVVVDDQEGLGGREAVALHAGADALMPMPEQDWKGFGTAVLASAERRAQARAIGDVIAVDQDLEMLGGLDPAEPLAVLAVRPDSLRTLMTRSQVRDADTIMVALAVRLRPVLRPSDLVARSAGDCLVIVRRGVDELAAAGLADRLLKATRLPLSIDEETVGTTISIGVALRGSADDRPISTLLREAESALAGTQAQGHSSYRLFDERLQSRVMVQRQIEMALRHAIENHEFRVFYQPVVELATGRLASFEALMRWQRPQGGGLANAASFVEAAQRSGLMSRIGQAILREAAVEARGWPGLGLTAPTLSVNLSPQEYFMPNLVASVSTVLRELNMEPGRLSLEIPRKLLEADPHLAVATLRDLAGLGVMLVADDYEGEVTPALRNLPVKMVKLRMGLLDRIDTDPQVRAELAATITSAREAHWLCVGKGVETPAQAAILRDLGCYGGQGFLFSGARPAQDLHLFRDASGAWAWTPKSRSAPTS